MDKFKFWETDGSSSSGTTKGPSMWEKLTTGNFSSSSGWGNTGSSPTIADRIAMETNRTSAFDDCLPSMSWSTKFKGFLACAVLGFALSILGAVMLFLGQVTLFCLFYVLGVLLSITGTGFLMGPKQQLEMMFSFTRLAATLLLFACIVMVFVSAFVIKSNILVIIFAIATYLAYAWYSLSYIPYGRAGLKAGFRTIV